MKRILVIGGAGFIGSHLVDRLIAEGKQVRVLDKAHVELRPDWEDNLSVEYLAGEFVDHSVIDVAVKDIDVVYHLLSTTIPATSNIDPIFDVQSNLVGTLNFLKAAVDAGVKKVIFVSSGGTVYGKPVNIPIRETDPTDPICSYGITKLAIEKYLAMYETLYGLRHTVFRLANPYGERQRPGAQGAIAAFMQKIAKGSSIEVWGDGSVVRDYIHINDVIDVLVEGALYDGGSRIFNVGSGEGSSLNEIIHALRQVTGQSVKCIYKAGRALDVPKSVLDIQLIKQELGWAPKIDLAHGLTRTWNWFQHQTRV